MDPATGEPHAWGLMPYDHLEILKKKTSYLSFFIRLCATTTEARVREPQQTLPQKSGLDLWLL